MSDYWTTIKCDSCRESFCITTALYDVLKRTGRTWWCPNGHKWHFTMEPTEADKIRQERDRLRQQLAERDDAIAAKNRALDKAAERQAKEKRRVAAARGQVTRLKNRAAAGLCPCCNRSFTNLHAHMATQHPEFRAAPQDADKVA